MFEQPKIAKHRLFYPIAIVLTWTAFGLFFGTQNYVRDSYLGQNPNLSGYLTGWLLCGYTWALLTVPVLWFARQFSLKRLQAFRFFLTHVAAGIAFSMTQLGIYSLLAKALFDSRGRTLFEYYEFLLVNELQSSVLVYFVTISVLMLYDHFLVPTEPANEQADATDKIKITTAMSFHRENGQNGSIRRIPVKENGRIVLLNVTDIGWITSEGNYVKLHTPQKRYLVRDTMNGMEKKLDSTEFVRLRRSTIVQIAEIKEFRPTFNGEYEVVLKTGTRLCSSRRYRKNLETILKS